MLDKHKSFVQPSEEEIEMMSQLMHQFIMPNEPKTADQKAAFQKAVRFQIAHEQTLAQRVGDDQMPAGVTRFTIGHFSATIESSEQPVIDRKTICPYAYSVLMRAGLLYRGVQEGELL